MLWCAWVDRLPRLWLWVCVLVCLFTAGEFQEVVDSKLRHTHPRVQKQRAAAANLAAATAAATAASIASTDESQASDAEGSEDTAAQPSSSRRQADADARAAAAASSSGTGIQVIQVLPWADAESAAAAGDGGGSSGEVLLELDNVSINTPDGGLALVQNLSLKVSGAEGGWHPCTACRREASVRPPPAVGVCDCVSCSCMQLAWGGCGAVLAHMHLPPTGLMGGGVTTLQHPPVLDPPAHGSAGCCWHAGVCW